MKEGATILSRSLDESQRRGFSMLLICGGTEMVGAAIDGGVGFLLAFVVL